VNTPRVSIVIPVYNGVNYMREAIDSALAQTYPNIEVVVVNDGSTDGGETERVALSYGDAIRYVRKENGGCASALNTGIQEMTGEYFSWLSHDDLYHPEKVQAQVEAALAAGGDRAVVYCAYQEIDSRGAVIGGGLHPERYDDAIDAIFATVIHGCALLIPARCFEVAGLFNPELETTPDSEMWLRIALAGFPFHYLPRVLVQSRQHGEQGSRTIARHVEHRHQWYLWAIDALGPEERRRRGDTLPMILLRREQIGPFLHLLRTFRRDQGVPRVLGVLLEHGPLLIAQFCRRALRPVARGVGIRRGHR
jgi:glycosyltransferase involved in cell wall biosynthesis